MDRKIEIEIGGKRYGFHLLTTDVEAHSLMSAQPEAWAATVQGVRNTLQLAVSVAQSRETSRG